ncbi:hypothetical protein KGF57_004464 [Candida theae]|uniref:Uncharacterized protein n=1 Tax=Candida theae TaxID=1198502 RepID=A0AAD5BBI7_9ASCO|nr:uncharacterized protein KGF57_004464 [Candida theae]KAI5949954.1 hypothetical protein KGF57_004464 [Candida theae]
MHISKGFSKLNLESIAPDLNLPFPHNNSNNNTNGYAQPKPNKPNKPIPVAFAANNTASGGIGTDELDETPPPSVLKCIDYDYLEKHLEIYRYYPSYFHNDGITTPELKDLIIDKPIYNEANKHVKRKKRKSTKSKLREKNETEDATVSHHTNPLQEARQLRKEHREERRELRKEQRDERKQLKQSQKQQSQSQSQSQSQPMKKSYSGHYMNKVNNLSCANGGSQDVGSTQGYNPYQSKTQFRENSNNNNNATKNTGDEYYWNRNQPMSRTNSQFSYGGSSHNNYDFNMKKIDSSSTSSDEGPDCAELDPIGMAMAESGKSGNGGPGGYDSERTEVEDEYNPIAFNNPFDFGKKLSGVGSTMKEEGGIAPVSSAMMSNSSSYNNYSNGPTKTHQNSLFSNPQYSYLYSSRNNSRNNSVTGPTTGLPENHPVPVAVPQRRNSSVTLINSSQNSSQNRNNTTANNNNNDSNNNNNNNNNNRNSISYGSHTISQPKRNNSIASKFMSMFKSDSEDSNDSSNGNHHHQNYHDDDEFMEIDENASDGATTMMRKGSSKLSHKINNNTSMSRRQSILGQAQAQSTLHGEESIHKPKTGPLAASGNVFAGAHPMAKSSSFDQTKSQRTKLKNKLKMKFSNESRRFSEQFGMYTFGN